MTIDTHVHLTDEAFIDDKNEVFARAAQAGITKMFEISCEQNLWDKDLEISARQNIFVAFGIHPNYSHTATEADFKKLKRLIKNPKCLAVGECGLDYHYDFAPVATQKEIFRKQLDIAIENEKPIIIHSRQAYDDLINILQSYKNLPKGIIHSFEGSPSQAQNFIDMGFLIGICSTITYPKCDQAREVAAKVDIKHLLAETDCPYRAPQKFRGKRSEPAFVIEVIKEIAKAKNLTFEQTDIELSKNFEKLFGVKI
jgi:TatD DNase family protein